MDRTVWGQAVQRRLNGWDRLLKRTRRFQPNRPTELTHKLQRGQRLGLIRPTGTERLGANRSGQRSTVAVRAVLTKPLKGPGRLGVSRLKNCLKPLHGEYSTIQGIERTKYGRSTQRRNWNGWIPAAHANRMALNLADQAIVQSIERPLKAKLTYS